MRRAALILLVACLALAGCGGDDETAGEAARHLDPASDAVLAFDLDYDSENWGQIKRLYARAVDAGLFEGEPLAPPTLDGALSAAAGFAGLSFEDDIRPLLGGTLYAGVRVEPAEPLPDDVRDLLERVDLDATRFEDDGEVYYGHDGRPLRDVDPAEVQEAIRLSQDRQPEVVTTLAYEVGDPEALKRVIERLRGQGLEPQPVEGGQRLAEGVGVAGDDTLVAVVADDEDTDVELRRRLAAGDAPDVPVLDGDLLAARAAPGVLGGWLDRGELDRVLASRPGVALRGAELRLRAEEDALRGRARVDFEGLADDELPLPGPGPLALPSGELVASASTNQSVTTVFLARLARALWPDSRFVRRVEALEAQEGISFEAEVLRQFDGPSFTVLRQGPNGNVEFGARSTIRDPAAMRALLERIAPALPGILEGLQGLGNAGLTGLLFVAPDAPLTPSALALLAQVGVTQLEAGDAALYEVRGLDPDNRQPGPDRVVYGLVGDAFVVGSSEELAREVAAMTTEPAPDAATRLRFDAAQLARSGQFVDEADAELARALLGGGELSASAEDGDIVASGELRWR